MIYEVRARIFFEEKEAADWLIEELRRAMTRAVVVHPDEPNQEGSSIELIKCFHDQTPTTPCITCETIKCPPDPLK